jgi:hypothetical protein
MTRASSARQARRKLRKNPPKMIVRVELPETPPEDGLQRMRITGPDGKVLHEVRALLCMRCNATLGMVREDVALLAKLAAYVEAHR